MTLLNESVREAARRSVLCWLATVDAGDQPNVSPKEVWTIADDQHVVVAHIASSNSARNVAQHLQACLSFVDVFVLNDLFVAPTARRLGVGEALLTAAADHVRQLGAVRLSLNTDLQNLPAQALYESMGWERDENFMLTTWF